MVATERSDSASALADEVVEGVERGLAVARPRQRARVVARLLAPAHRVRDERLEQPHQRPPLLHGATELVHGLLRSIARGSLIAARASARMLRRSRACAGPIAAFGRKAGFSPYPLLGSRA